MTYFTKHTVLPSPTDVHGSPRVEIFYINREYYRVVEYNSETNKIEIDTMHQCRVEGDNVGFPIREGEEIYDPVVYYILP